MYVCVYVYIHVHNPHILNIYFAYKTNPYKRVVTQSYVTALNHDVKKKTPKKKRNLYQREGGGRARPGPPALIWGGNCGGWSNSTWVPPRFPSAIAVINIIWIPPQSPSATAVTIVTWSPPRLSGSTTIVIIIIIITPATIPKIIPAIIPTIIPVIIRGDNGIWNGGGPGNPAICVVKKKERSELKHLILAWLQ